MPSPYTIEEHMMGANKCAMLKFVRAEYDHRTETVKDGDEARHSIFLQHVGIKKALQLPKAIVRMILRGTVDIDIAAQIVAAPLPRQNTEDYGSSQDTNFEDKKTVRCSLCGRRGHNNFLVSEPQAEAPQEHEAEQEPVAEPQPFNPSLPSGPNIKPDEPQQED